MWPTIRREASTQLAPHRRFRPITPGQQPEPAPPPIPAPLPPEGLYEGEPENCRRHPRQLVRVMAHLGLMLAVYHAYHVEGRAFRILNAIALAALPIHYALPFRWKKPFFIAASVAGLGWVLGPQISAAVLPLAALLIGVCYLPLPWAARASIVGALGLGMAAVRAGLLSDLPMVPDGVWPVLGTMFMFRMIIYLYELKHARRPEPVVDTLSYFFLLPNYCFLHFPVVDYRTLQRGYFSRPIDAIQEAGLRMMFRGTVHLLLYRVIYHEALITPDEVSGPASLLGYLACNYLLYLRVSGQFHLACGMLHLFGFALPETHHNYLLATGFTDYWRRINIYWKDFMVRVVFNPVAFRLKRRPQWQALAAATTVVFLATWLLHAYQSFWLRGTWGFSVTDALFWGILGGLVLVNVQLDARSTRRPARPGAPISYRALAIRSAKTAGTFAAITLLWSLWSSPSLSAWLAMFERAF